MQVENWEFGWETEEEAQIVARRIIMCLAEAGYPGYTSYTFQVPGIGRIGIGIDRRGNMEDGFIQAVRKAFQIVAGNDKIDIVPTLPTDSKPVN